MYSCIGGVHCLTLPFGIVSEGQAKKLPEGRAGGYWSLLRRVKNPKGQKSEGSNTWYAMVYHSITVVYRGAHWLYRGIFDMVHGSTMVH